MKRKSPNVILIVMDTVRADHLSCYGYDRRTTPNIDDLARHGVLYENAFSTATWSPPSHASIFTGKYPSYHKTLGRNVYLEKANRPLAHILKSSGYHTMGVSNCSLVGLGTGFDTGFERFVEPRNYSRAIPKEFRTRASTVSMLLESLFHSPQHFVRDLILGPDQYNALTNDIIKSFIRENADSSPFFLFINYFNCHAPYDPPRPFKGKFCDGFVEPRFFIMEFFLERAFGKTGEKLLNRNLDMVKLKRITGSSAARFSYMARELQISKEEWEIVESWYDGEIAYLDHCINELVTFLREEELFDNTILVITADHGENFGEHGLAGHHFGLYDSVLHVPLVMSCPAKIPEKEIPQIVSTIDILPTVVSLCDLNVQEEIQGRKLDPFTEQKVHDFVCAESGESVTEWALSFGGQIVSERALSIGAKVRDIDIGSKGIRNEEFKYTLSANGREELYNVAEDPAEKWNIIDEHRTEARRLRRQLEKTLDITYFGPGAVPYDDQEKTEIAKRLRALGYI